MCDVVSGGPPGKSIKVLRVLPAHASELAGRSSRNLERIRVAESAVIDVNAATNVVYIVAGDDDIGRVTVSAAIFFSTTSP